jgi:hypothetical protein
MVRYNRNKSAARANLYILLFLKKIPQPGGDACTADAGH